MSVCAFLTQHLACAVLVNFHKPTGQGEPSFPLFHTQGMGTKWEKGWLGLYRSSLDLIYSVFTETQKYGAQPPALSQSFQRNYVPMSVTSTELSEC